MPQDSVDLPVGSLLASASPSTSPFAFTATVTEHLEAKELDGSDSVLVATSGDDLIDDLAAVLSFRTNSVFSRDVDLVRRLVSRSDGGERRGPGALFKDTFDADRYLPDAEIDELRTFMTALLDLRRDRYEAVMRAIRRIVRATQRAIDDPTLAYVDLVAALESLAGSADEPPAWDRLDGRKRKLIDGALEGADAVVVERVRTAVLEAEQAGARWRFENFVVEHVGPEYFRDEAIGQLRPVRGLDLVPGLNQAYTIRSGSVHSLDELSEHVTALHDGADTTWAPGDGVLLTLQGLARLARHVIADVVDRAPTGIAEWFDWRSAIPGRIEMRLAPQYWLWQAAGMTHASAERYFGGFADHVLSLWSGEGEGVLPMGEVLERIEELVPGTQPGPAKTAMVGLFRAWHGLVDEDHQRPNADTFLAAHADSLAEPSMVAFVTGLLCDQLPDWVDDQWREVGEARRTQRARRKQLDVAPRYDAALHAVISEKSHLRHHAADALRFAGYAIEELPGELLLIDWESALRDGTAQELDIGHVLTGCSKAGERDAPDEVVANPGDDDGRNGGEGTAPEPEAGH